MAEIIAEGMAEAITISDEEDDINFVDKSRSLLTHANRNIDDADIFYAKRSRLDIVIGPWQPCKLLECIESINGNERTNIVMFNGGFKKDVATYEMAIRRMSTLAELEIGTRVISKRRSEDMPYTMNHSGEQIPLITSIDSELYPGIVAGYHESQSEVNQLLLFFDDGIVQYVPQNKIRRVLGNDSYNHAHWNAKSYFEFFLNNKQWQLRPKLNEILDVELNGTCQAKAKVVEINASLVKIHFANVNRFEWIFLGCPRLSRIYRKLIMENLLDNMIDLKSYNTCLSADNEVVVVDLIDPGDGTESETISNDSSTHKQSTQNVNGKKSSKHTCTPDCLRMNDQMNENNTDLGKYSAFERPLLVGWTRVGIKKVSYRTPCGIVRCSYKDIYEYLDATMSKLRIDCFNLDAKIRIELPKVCSATGKVNDISRGVETIPIPVRDQQIALDFNYISGYNFDYIELEPEDNLGRSGCNCKDNCRDKSKCSCWQLTVEIAKQKRINKRKYKQYMDIGYEHMRLQNDVDGIIVECNSKCKCCAEKCMNRVVKNGIQQQLEVFLTESKGWGVRAKNDMPKGVFVCVYAGDVLEETAADKRDTKYQFKLKSLKGSTSQNHENDDDSDNEPPAKMTRRNLDDVIQPFINFFPTILNENAKNFPESEVCGSNEDKHIMVDAIKNGNVSRFFNHSCDPNMLTQLVHVDDDERFPLIAFFTNKWIKAGDELTFDYSCDEIDGWETKCHCNTSKCRKRLM